MQLFQPSFEICPFETELNMDIAAALKVCPPPPWQPAPPAPAQPALPLSAALLGSPTRHTVLVTCLAERQP